MRKNKRRRVCLKYWAICKIPRNAGDFLLSFPISVIIPAVVVVLFAFLPAILAFVPTIIAIVSVVFLSLFGCMYSSGSVPVDFLCLARRITIWILAIVGISVAWITAWVRIALWVPSIGIRVG